MNPSVQSAHKGLPLVTAVLQPRTTFLTCHLLSARGAARSSFSRRRPRAGPISVPTALPPPSPRVTMMIPQRMPYLACHTPHGPMMLVSSSGWAHSPITLILTGLSIVYVVDGAVLPDAA